MKKKIKKPIDTIKVSGGVNGDQATNHNDVNQHVGLKDKPKEAQKW